MKAVIKYLKTQVFANISAGVLALAALITALALLLRLIQLGQDSLWADEIYSVMQAQQGWDSLWNQIRQGQNMAFYYALLHFWLILGESEFVIRSLSVIPAVLTVLLVYLLGKRLFDVKVGLIAALLLAVNAFHIQYSQEARSYTLLVFLVTLSSLLLARSIERSSSGMNWITSSGPASLVPLSYIAVSVLAVYAHFFALMALAAQAASLLFLPRRILLSKGLLASITAVGIALGFILAPLAISSITTGPATITREFTWVPATSLDRVYRFVLDLTGKGGALLLILYLIPALIGVVSFVKTWASAKASFESWKYALLLLWLLLPILVTLGFSLLATPLFISGYLIICLPPLTILAAVGICQIYRAVPLWLNIPASRWVTQIGLVLAAGILVAALVMLSFRGVSAYHANFVKDDWRGAARFAASQWQPGDGIVFYVPWADDILGYYLQKSQPGTSEMTLSVLGRSWADLTRPSNIGLDQRAIAESIPDYYNRVWLALAHNSLPSRQPVSDEIQAALESKYPFSLATHFSGIKLVLYSKGEPGRVVCQEVVEDSSGSGNHGTPLNEPTRTAGKFGEALEFDGNNDYVSAGGIYRFEGTSPFTVSLWAKDSGASGSYDRLVSKETPVGVREGWLIFRDDDQNRYGFERWQDGATDKVDFAYASGQWNHIVFTYDGTHMRGYLNGELAAGPAISSKSIQPKFASLTIGTRSDAGLNFYDGLIDEVRIYDRALSNTQVAELAQGLAQTPDGSLVAHWKFDEGSGAAGSVCF